MSTVGWFGRGIRSGLPASASTAVPASFLATYRLDTEIRRSSVMPRTPRSNRNQREPCSISTLRNPSQNDNDIGYEIATGSF